MNPTLIPLANSPLNRLFFAINHYISTGDAIGEGVALVEGMQKSSDEPAANANAVILLAVNSKDQTDTADFEKFVSRFSQLQARFSTSLKNLGKANEFWQYSFSIAYGQCDDLAQALIEQPGSLGWGSMKSMLEKNFPS
jgi:hypothetical protein